MHRRGGARSHLGVVSPRWGLWNSSRGWTLHHSYIRSQCRRCLCILSQRVASCSPGCASAISGRDTSLNPGPESMASAGANHGESLGARQGCWCRQEAEEGPVTARGKGELEGQARGGSDGQWRGAAVDCYVGLGSGAA